MAMAVSLVKLEAGKPLIIDSLPNEVIIRCSKCPQIYRLGYPDSEWNRVKDWIGIAERAIREDHERKHAVTSIGLAWKSSTRR
jgi:hypothetical protein